MSKASTRILMVICFVFMWSSHATAAGLSCKAIMCLSNEWEFVNPVCRDARQEYFSYVVYNPYFNAPATAVLRAAYIATCPQLTSTSPNLPKILTFIATKYGSEEFDPDLI